MYQNILGGINTFGFGLSDNFTLNLSTEMFTLVMGQVFIFNVNPKYTFGVKDSNVRFGVGHNMLVGFANDDVEGYGTTYGLVTFGSEYKNLTAGVGFGYSFRAGYQSSLIFQLSGTYPISKRVSIMLDAFFVTDGIFDCIVTPTLRYNYKQITIDIGIANGIFDNNTPIPVLSASTLF